MKVCYFFLSLVSVYVSVIVSSEQQVLLEIPQKALPALPQLNTAYFESKGIELAEQFIQHLQDSSINESESYVNLHLSIIQTLSNYITGSPPCSVKNVGALSWLQKYAQSFRDSVSRGSSADDYENLLPLGANPVTIGRYCKKKRDERFYKAVLELITINEIAGILENHTVQIQRLNLIKLEEHAHLLDYYYRFGQRIGEFYVLGQANLVSSSDIHTIEVLEQEYMTYCHTLISRLSKHDEITKSYCNGWHCLYVFSIGVRLRMKTVQNVKDYIGLLSLKAKKKWSVKLAIIIMTFVDEIVGSVSHKPKPNIVVYDEAAENVFHNIKANINAYLDCMKLLNKKGS